MISDFHCKPSSNSNMTIESASVRVVDTIEKSDSDIWNYRGLELDNGMICVLISHPTIDKAAAGLNVEIGSYADPNEVPGVAHFLEHMLFMGSTKNMRMMNFQFYEKDSPDDFVSDLAGQLRDYPLSECLFGPYDMREFRPDLIQALLNDYLIPSRMR
ncbi:unnamed protein product [Rotaria sordida]|uniref:Peptidase M16 N-terminal domain-containing protein n=1 Tax=Rotaria sordida TaxID=392033 RepID=A0A815S3J2_9BILA|nr:unnamed protein product [Rotaria sordida]CAF4167030.1 unnamed protein product [Rotaria sordida]